MIEANKESGKRNRWPEETSDFRSPWVWGMGALFVLFLGVEFTMITIALNAKPDLVTADFYERGQSFTERSKMRSATIEKLGWKMDLTFGEIRKDEPALFSLSITSKGAAEVGENVVLFAYRPSNAKKDFQMRMGETAEGDYQAELIFSEPGYWDIIVVARKDGKEADLAKRIYVKSN